MPAVRILAAVAGPVASPAGRSDHFDPPEHRRQQRIVVARRRLRTERLDLLGRASRGARFRRAGRALTRARCELLELGSIERAEHGQVLLGDLPAHRE